MKNIILVICAIAISITSIAQTTYQKPNGDRYLLHNTYGLVFDIDSLEEIAQKTKSCPPFVIDDRGIYISDYAQPCYSDSLLTIVGVSALFFARDYKEMNAYLCIADTNFEIYRAVKIPSTDNVNSTYTEVFFETPINIKGKFMIIWDNPKPDRYGEYEYNFSYENADKLDVRLAQVFMRYIEEYATHCRFTSLTSTPTQTV